MRAATAASNIWEILAPAVPHHHRDLWHMPLARSSAHCVCSMLMAAWQKTRWSMAPAVVIRMVRAMPMMAMSMIMAAATPGPIAPAPAAAAAPARVPAPAVPAAATPTSVPAASCCLTRTCLKQGTESVSSTDPSVPMHALNDEGQTLTVIGKAP